MRDHDCAHRKLSVCRRIMAVVSAAYLAATVYMLGILNEM
jgi:hypothetical protein